MEYYNGKSIKRLRSIKVDETTIELDDATNIISVKDGVVALQNATTSVLGGVKQSANQADSVATTVELLVTDFNALLAKLKTAGLMVADI